MKCSLGISNFLEEISSLFPFYCFPLFLCIDHWERLSYLSLLFFETLNSNVYIFPFLFGFHLSFLSYLKGLLRQPFCLFVFIFLEDGLEHCLLQCHRPPSIVLQALFLSDLIFWIYLIQSLAMLKNAQTTTQLHSSHTLASNAQNSPSQALTVHEPWTSRYSSWI